MQERGAVSLCQRSQLLVEPTNLVIEIGHVPLPVICLITLGNCADGDLRVVIFVAGVLNECLHAAEDVVVCDVASFPSLSCLLSSL